MRTARAGGTKRTAGPPDRRTALLILRRLKREYPGAKCALDFTNPYQLLVATILSAQCTDVRVNLVTPALFQRFPSAHELAQARQAELEEMIRSTGFFRNKTRSLIGMAQAVVANHQGEIPRTMDQLRLLPGVGRKTANVVLGNAFGINDGVPVDTHVTRLSGRLKLSRQKTAEKIEQDLMKLIPRKDWTLVSHLLILHGRRVCGARKPKCGQCVVARLCPSAEL